MEKDIKRDFYDGILREEYEFLTENNLRDGLSKLYNCKGNLEEETYYELGKKQGKSKEYFNGEWKAEGEYFDGKKTGVWLEKQYNDKIKKFVYFDGVKQELEIENISITETSEIKKNYLINLIIMTIIITASIILNIFLWTENNHLEKKLNKNYVVEETLAFPETYKEPEKI